MAAPAASINLDRMCMGDLAEFGKKPLLRRGSGLVDQCDPGCSSGLVAYADQVR
jgi:hypothetical protein